ncbi:hypothetical protein I1E95_15100 [Synechococcus sp. CBW1107]|uniref:hypothetical protein n=1 Tax=Synechococcus sp. CBW1107 TaxID=2789857 RepID=UPI0018CEC3BC|nr:hypothetical protein [Synechococcus sp. CBW1107]QPN56382.1 hypothetical protein I1E95_15100 [Synechococcus sp. CBW1107]CAK6697804.1 hypothetical protein BBFGKLBO_02327 [Synechococcus sp. CBW1107]
MTAEPKRAALLGRLRSTAVLLALFFGLPLAGLMVISWAVSLVAEPILTPANIWTFVLGQLLVASVLSWLLAWKFPVV